MSVQRYSPSRFEVGVRVDDDNGIYVLYKDHQERVERLEVENAELKKIIENDLDQAVESLLENKQ